MTQKTPEQALEAIPDALERMQEWYEDYYLILCQALSAKQWQTMDTAPRDGSTIIIYCEGAAWEVTTYKTAHDFSPICMNATHWMPLPMPPKMGD